MRLPGESWLQLKKKKKSTIAFSEREALEAFIYFQKHYLCVTLWRTCGHTLQTQVTSKNDAEKQVYGPHLHHHHQLCPSKKPPVHLGSLERHQIHTQEESDCSRLALLLAPVSPSPLTAPVPIPCAPFSLNPTNFCWSPAPAPLLTTAPIDDSTWALTKWKNWLKINLFLPFIYPSDILHTYQLCNTANHLWLRRIRWVLMP